MRKYRYPVLSLILMACGPPLPGPEVQALLDSYAPELRIGGRVSAAAHRGYQLRVLPYTGYRDSQFTTTDGLSDVMIQVDEYIDDGNPKVSPRARIEAVSFRVRDASASAALIARANASLGMPEVSCFQSPEAGRRISRYWPGTGKRGLLLVMRLGPAIPADMIPGMATIPVGSGTVKFGAEPPTKVVGIVPEDCLSS